MSTFSNAGRQVDAWNSDWKVVAATAGFVFFAILPVAWYTSAVVASGMQLSPGWRAASIMAVTTFVLMTAAYGVLAAPSEAESLTNGSLGLDMAIQALVSALPFASRRVLGKPSTTS